MSRVKEEQERKFREMMEAERIKADIEAIAKQEEEEKAAVAEANKAKERERRAELVRSLGQEPQSGDIINIAVRLPNGSRLLRNFRQDEPVKVRRCDQSILAFIFSKEEFPLESRLDLLYDYPPLKIGEEQLEKTFAEFFPGSDRQLITVNEEE